MEVWEIPPNGQGLAALIGLNILEGYDVAGMGHNSPQLLHTMIETMRLAFADAQRYIADSDWEREQALPTEALLSKDCKWSLFASGRCLSPKSTTNVLPNHSYTCTCLSARDCCLADELC